VDEVKSLRVRRSNVNRLQIAMRTAQCQALA
jgi:hypothetical protein